MKVIFLLLVSIATSHCLRGCPDKEFCCRIDFGPPYGTCTYPGYAPGGNQVILEPIDAPQAVLQDSAVATFSKYLNYDVQGVNTALDVVDLVADFDPYAKVVAAGLSIFGKIIGGIAGISSPTPQDIIDSVNKALDTLTQEVNDQFTNMQAYVDQSILDEDSELMNLSYKKYLNLYENCVKATNEDDMYSCIKTANDESAADVASFVRYQSQMNDGAGYNPTVADVKQMESLFLTYRNYAQLRVMILLTLSGIYTNKTNPTDDDRAEAKRYLQDLQSELSLYIEYTQFCYDNILKMHTRDNEFYKNSEKCDGIYWMKEGGKHTWDTMTCSFLLSKMLVSTQTCSFKGGVRYKSDCPCPSSGGNMFCDNSPWPNAGESDSWNVVNYLAYNMVNPSLADYTNDDYNSVINYWQPQVIDNCIPNWKSLNEQVGTQLENYKDVQETRKTEL